LNLTGTTVEPLAELGERQVDDRADEADAPLGGGQRPGVEDPLRASVPPARDADLTPRLSVTMTAPVFVAVMSIA
jgi:hypothetical protein